MPALPTSAAGFVRAKMLAVAHSHAVLAEARCARVVAARPPVTLASLAGAMAEVLELAAVDGLSEAAEAVAARQPEPALRPAAALRVPALQAQKVPVEPAHWQQPRSRAECPQPP